jgi:hypothetical protein
MSRGYVYILSNPSMPGLVKIGRTIRCVDGRANELYQTGVPTPFNVEFSIFSPDCEEMEIRAHEKFANERVSESREFFKVDVDAVVQHLEEDLLFQVECLVADFMPDHIVVRSEYHTAPSDVAEAAQANGLHAAEVQGVLSQITAEEMAPLVARYREWVEARTAKILAASAKRNAEGTPVIQ